MREVTPLNTNIQAYFSMNTKDERIYFFFQIDAKK